MKHSICKRAGNGTISYALAWKRVIPPIPFYRAFLPILFLFLSGLCKVYAQQCPCESGIQAATDIDCNFLISGETVFDGSTCLFPVTIRVRAATGIVASGVLDSLLDTFLIQDLSAFLNQTLSVEVFQGSSQVPFCAIPMDVVDRMPPVFLSCQDTIVNCNVDTSAANLGFPLVQDNCSNVALQKRDSVVLLDCRGSNDTLTARIYRKWFARDQSGNLDSCVQEIWLRKLDPGDVTLPAVVKVPCDNPDTSPSNTGFPLVDGVPVRDIDPICNLWSELQTPERIVNVCDNVTFKINRRWLIEDNCSGSFAPNFIENVIEVVDTIPAVIDCQDTIEIATDPLLCTATVLLDRPDVTDNCTPNPTLTAEVFGIGLGFGPFMDVRPGTYPVTFRAEDCSDSVAVCRSTLKVVDGEEPTAICRRFTVVSLNSTGTALVPASAFNEGSFDNCDQVGFLASRDGVQFFQSIQFDCADAGLDSIMIVLRVFERNRTGVFDDCMLFVEVQDKLRPLITCPANRTIDCHDDYSDLSIFDTAMVMDMCGAKVDERAVYNISNCGVGTINRIFTATDSSGNQATCTQVISVVNNQPFNSNAIIWPADITLTTCNPSVHPDDLPVGSGRPQLPQDSCAMLFTNYEDTQFNGSFPACYKIFREWTVLEMCSNTRYRHTQKIIISDQTRPQLFCPPNQTVAAGADCNMTQVNLPSATVNDCDPMVMITHNSRFATAQGANASGTYPFGTTRVTFRAEDKCGNVSTCNFQINVMDLTAPTAHTVNRLALELGQMGGMVGSFLNARAYDAGSRDNCTASRDLKFTMRRYNPALTTPATDTSLFFNCDLIGIDTLEIWVMDQAGNSDRVLVELDIQDNFNRCVNNRPLSISGTLKTTGNQPVVGAKVALQGGAIMQTLTDSLGRYHFSNLVRGAVYTVVPFKDDDVADGISTFDMVVLSRHILNVGALIDPYRIIAADVNNSKSISTLDLVALRKVILRAANSFPVNTSWRFVPKNFSFRDPAQPLSEPFNEVVTLDPLAGPVSNVDFVGIKIGDVNGSYVSNLRSVQHRNTNTPLRLQVEETRDSEEGIIEIPLVLSRNEKISGLQFGLRYDAENWSFLGWEKADLPDLSEANFGTQFSGDGRILFSWNQAEPVSLEAEQAIFALRFQRQQNGWAGPGIKLDDALLMPECYLYRAEDIRPIEISAIESKGSYELFQNKPNPFDRGTVIEFFIPENTTATLRILDVSGKIIKVFNGNYEAGKHEIRLSRRDLPQPGVYFYQLQTPRFHATRKLISL